MTQCERILRHLRDFGSITQAEAITEYGCYRLAARVADLRAAGHPIEAQMDKGVNRYGEKISFARYTLGEGAPDGDG